MTSRREKKGKPQDRQGTGNQNTQDPSKLKETNKPLMWVKGLRRYIIKEEVHIANKHMKMSVSLGAVSLVAGEMAQKHSVVPLHMCYNGSNNNN